MQIISQIHFNLLKLLGRLKSKEKSEFVYNKQDHFVIPFFHQ